MISQRPYGLVLVAACTALFAALALAVMGCGSSSGGGSTTSPAASQTSSASGSPAANPTGTPTSAASTPSQPSGGPVPSGFKAASVTFVSTQKAFVLGKAPGSGLAVLRTLDRGGSWVALAAPAVPLGRPFSGGSGAVWGIRFASPLHGFVFGKGLWETADGGATWTKDAQPSGQILSIAMVQGQVLALVAKSTSGTANLKRRPVNGSGWTTIATVKTFAAADSTDLIAAQAGTAAVLSGSKIVVTADGGATTSQVSTPSSPGGVLSPASVAVTSANGLALLYSGNGAAGSTQKMVYVSSDGGAHWTKAGAPPVPGDPVTMAAGSPSRLIVAAASGGSMLYRSGNGGKTWKTVVNYGDGGAGFADLGFTTASYACVVRGPANNGGGGPGQLLLSSDGGASWQKVAF